MLYLAETLRVCETQATARFIETRAQIEMTSRKRGGLREGFESTCVLGGKVPVYLEVKYLCTCR